jgi:hypothetical protein
VVPAPVPIRLAGRHHGLVALAVCALFDAAGQRLIRSLWARLEDAGIGSLASHTHRHHHPHLSYAVLRTGEFDRVCDTLARLPDGGSFPANVQGTVVFPRGRVALAVAVPAAVALRQDRATSALTAAGAQLHKHYRPPSWIPHVSVAMRTPGALLPVAVTAISDVLPATLTVAGAALVDTGTGEMWPLPGIP